MDGCLFKAEDCYINKNVGLPHNKQEEESGELCSLFSRNPAKLADV